VTLVELVVAVHRSLAGAGIDHAFGGALALAYVGDPRGTIDIDVNVFVPPDELGRVFSALGGLGLRPEADGPPRVPTAGVRLRSGDAPYPVDLFPSLDHHYEEVRRRCVVHSFGPDGTGLHFLSAEDLAVFKLSFGRGKDWVDLAAMAKARPGLDVDYVENQLTALRGPTMLPRLARLRRMLRDGGRGPDAP
jgi:hypothetical protein